MAEVEAAAPDVGTPQKTQQELETGQSSKHRASIEDLLKAGTHFGHLTSRWNPKMKPYIFMERNNIHIIDLMQTQVLLDAAAEAASRFSRQGKRILFVGTKKQAKDIVRQYADECESPYAVERWLGGTLTNFQTIRKSIRRMEELAKMEEEGTFDVLKKKERLMRTREREKLEKVLLGIAEMPRLPGAIFLVDVRREHIAIDEARKLNIPVIAMVDTNCDPELVDFPIPANDDALRSIELITSVISEAVNDGKRAREVQEASDKAQKEKKQEAKS
jgi:small subunit ribosomal protein S2